ncbi:hypothetical protein Droror1_Dr00017871 [Drosera rotundifolia]
MTESSAQLAHDRLLLGSSADLLRVEIGAANMEIALGRYEAAVNTLKLVHHNVNLPDALGSWCSSWQYMEDDWVKSLYEDQRKWVPLYIGDAFLAAMSSVHRSESVNSFFDKFGLSPKDDLIVALAKSFMESPVAHDDDVIGSAFLLNLIDAIHRVEVIEEQLKTMEDGKEISSIMNVGMTYSLLHSSEIDY